MGVLEVGDGVCSEGAVVMIQAMIFLVVVGLAVFDRLAGGWLVVFGVPIPWAWLGLLWGCLWLPRALWPWLGLVTGVAMDIFGGLPLGAYTIFIFIWLMLVSKFRDSWGLWWRSWWWLAFWGIMAVGLVLLILYEVAWAGDWAVLGKQWLYYVLIMVGWLTILGLGPAWLQREYMAASEVDVD